MKWCGILIFFVMYLVSTGYVYAQSETELQAVEIEAQQEDIHFDHREMKAHDVDLSSRVGLVHLDDILSEIPGVRVSREGGRLERQTFSYRGASAQDITVRYRGIALNSLSDGSADLSLIPAALLGNGRLYSTGAGSVFSAPGGLLEFNGMPDNDTPIGGEIALSSLLDFSLLTRGRGIYNHLIIGGAAFGDGSKGEFPYIDAQGQLEHREHNESSRVGGLVEMQYQLPFGSINLFSFVSRVEREEPGVSEYPAHFRYADQAHWLWLNGLQMETNTIAIGSSYAIFSGAFHYKYAQKVYDNPTTYIGGSRLYSEYDEHHMQLSLGMQWFIREWVETSASFEYQYQRLYTTLISGKNGGHHQYNQHILSFHAGLKFYLFDEHFRINTTLRGDCPDASQCLLSPTASIHYRALDWLELWLSGAYGQRYPTFDERYYRTEFMRGNPDLDEQKSIQTTLGVSLSPFTPIHLTVDIYYHKVNDLIRFMPVTPSLFIANNISGANLFGADVSAKVNVWRELNVEIQYGCIHAETYEHTPLPNTPEHQLTGRLMWQDPRVSASFDVQYRSKESLNAAGTSWGKKRLRLNFQTQVHLNDHLSLALAAYNLTNDRAAQDILQRPLPGLYGEISLKAMY